MRIMMCLTHQMKEEYFFLNKMVIVGLIVDNTFTSNDLGHCVS